MADGVDTTQNPEKDLSEKEKAALEKLLPLLEKFVHEKVNLQVSGVQLKQLSVLALSKGLLNF